MIKNFASIILVLFASCGKRSHVEKAPFQAPLIKETKIIQVHTEPKVNLQDTFQIDYSLIDNDFISNPFGFDTTAYATLVRLKPRKMEAEAVVNQHVENQIDTLYTFYFENSNIKLYKLPDREYIVSAIIRDSLISLKDSIKIGMSKQSFINKFKGLGEAKLSDKTFRIELMDNEQRIDFEFVNNKLAQALFTGYID